MFAGLLAAMIFFLAACGSGDSDDDASAQPDDDQADDDSAADDDAADDDVTDDDSAGGESEYCKVDNQYHDLFCKVYERLFTESTFVNGDDANDFGDTFAYCPALIFTMYEEGRATDAEMAFVHVVTDGYKLRAQAFIDDPLSVLSDSMILVDSYIGVLGLLMGYQATQDPTFPPVIDGYFDAALNVLALLGDLIYYIPVPPYGPTTIISGTAGSLLHYPLAFQGQDRSDERMEQGLALLDDMERMTWNDQIGGYQYMAWAGDDFEYQYSNVTAIQGLVRAYRLTGDQVYLDRAERVADSLETLYSDQYGGYFASDESHQNAPHSGEEYIALSGSNYTIFALMLLYQQTGDEKYLDRAYRTLDFVWNTLYVSQEGLCYHDIQHGVLTQGYCSGCNWQLLYNLWLLDDVLDGTDLLPPAP